MQALFTDFVAYYANKPPTELIAVLLAVAYLVLAIRQNIWCWICAAVSTALYVYLFAGARLFMESVLNVFYFGMAVYGWATWRAGDRGEELPVSVWPLRIHMYAILAVACFSAASGYLLATYTAAEFPYLDSATTFGAFWATFLVARKILENWWYWLVIDLVSVFIYWSRGLEATSLLFVFYLVLIPIGLVSWTRSYRRRDEAAPP